MLLLFIRGLIIYTVILISMRIMGKRQVGQLQPFEFVITLLIAEVAAIPLTATDIPLLNGFVSILALLFAQIFVSYICLKSEKARNFISGKPVILVENGKLVETELRKQRYNINDLIEQLRVNGYQQITDVEFAILENNGQVTVIPKSQKRPVTPEDMNIPTQYEGLMYDLIIDGRILSENLKKLKLTSLWLKEELKKHNIDDYTNVFYAGINTQGNLFYQEKENT